MNNQDILLRVCSLLDNESLKTLSKTSLWSLIREFAQNQHFWYLRVQHLVEEDLIFREGDWKKAYYLLLVSLDKHNPFTKDLLEDKLSVEILLELGYDPSENGNFPIAYSSGNGYIEVVRLLLSDPRVDPSDRNDSAIRHASTTGYSEVVRLLLEREEVDPSSEENIAIRYASEYGHTEVVRLLLRDERVDPSVDDNYAIRYASENGHTEVVELLLEDKRVDPEAEDNTPISLASANGHSGVILLLQEAISSRR